MNPKAALLLLLLAVPACEDRTTERSGILHDGEWSVYNNMWGATTKPPRIEFEDYSQTVYRNVGGNRFAWRWKIDSDNDWVKGAPQVFTGQNPYVASAKAGTVLPMELSKIDRLYVSYDVRMVDLPTPSSHNVCWHLWITDGEIGPEHIKAELAIVLDHTSPEIHPVVDTLRIGVNRLAVHYWIHPRRGFPVIYAYYDQDAPRFFSGVLCLSELLGYAQTKGYISQGDRLSCVALMTELHSGAGGIMVRKVEMDLRY